MYEYSCRIVRVVDGDTVDIDIDLGFDLWLKKQRIRLYGVDTPESRTRDLEEKKYGFAAKAFVENHLPVGSKQTLRTRLDDRGKFGRILGEFVLTTQWEGKDIPTTINEQLVRHHYGVKYFGQSKDDIEAKHLKNREWIDV
mgnify:FL=1